LENKIEEQQSKIKKKIVPSTNIFTTEKQTC